MILDRAVKLHTKPGHHLPETSIRRWADVGKLETHAAEGGGERDEHGHWTGKRLLTRRGLAQFYAQWHTHEHFTRCDACPHVEEQGD